MWRSSMGTTISANVSHFAKRNLPARGRRSNSQVAVRSPAHATLSTHWLRRRLALRSMFLSARTVHSSPARPVMVRSHILAARPSHSCATRNRIVSSCVSRRGDRSMVCLHISRGQCQLPRILATTFRRYQCLPAGLRQRTKVQCCIVPRRKLLPEERQQQDHQQTQLDRLDQSGGYYWFSRATRNIENEFGLVIRGFYHELCLIHSITSCDSSPCLSSRQQRNSISRIQSVQTQLRQG